MRLRGNSTPLPRHSTYLPHCLHTSQSFSGLLYSVYATKPNRTGTVWYGTVRYSTVRHGMVRYGTVRYGKRDVCKQHFIALYCTIPLSASTLGAAGLVQYTSVGMSKYSRVNTSRADVVSLQVVQCIAEGDMLCCQPS